VGYGAEDLANESRGRRVVDEGAGAVGGNDLDPALLQHAVAGFLHDQIAGEPVCRLDDDCTDAVAGDALEDPKQTWPNLSKREHPSTFRSPQ
jgi:hypothetical protein